MDGRCQKERERGQRLRQAARKQTSAEDRFCLGMSDICPTPGTASRMTPTQGQVLDKPQGRKPRCVWRCREKAARLRGFEAEGSIRCGGRRVRKTAGVEAALAFAAPTTFAAVTRVAVSAGGWAEHNTIPHRPLAMKDR